MHKGLVGFAKYSILALTLVAFTFVAIVNMGVVSAAHTSSVDLQPELSPPNQNVAYTVTFCNDGSSTHSVDEVRIYRNMQYTDFQCDDKTGWEKYFIVAKQACQYVATSSDYYIDPDECQDFTFSAKTPQTGCELVWEFETRDLTYPDSGSINYLSDTTGIDLTPPVTEKEYGTPFFSDGTYDWITSDTPVKLKATDPTPCAIGVDKLYWRNTLMTQVPDHECIAACDFVGSGDWNIVNGDQVIIKKTEESCHLIEYYAVDKLENTETVNKQCVFVDDTPPLSVKTHDPEPLQKDGFDWVTDRTKIKLDCIDQGDHPVDQETLCFKVSLHDTDLEYLTEKYCEEYYGSEYKEHMENGYCCIYVGGENYYEFNFLEDSYHNLEYYCIDHLGNDERDYNLANPPKPPKEITGDGAWIQWYKVDSVPPSITKEMLGTENVDWIGDCPPEDETETCYVADNDEGGVKITAKDGGEICHVDDLDCYAEVWWETSEEECTEPYENGWCRVYFVHFNEEDTVNYYFQEDSNHKVVVNCEDALENEMIEDVEDFLVDSEPPETWKEYGQPQKVDPDCAEWCAVEYCGKDGQECFEDCIHQYCTWWITSDTPITLTSYDEKVGQVYDDTIYWRNILLEDDMPCWEPGEFCVTYEDDIVGKLDWNEGDNNPYYQDCDGPSMDPPYGCWAGASSPVDPSTVGAEIAKGFGDHRTYEYAMPLSYLGVSEGDLIKLGVYTLDGKHKAYHRIANHRPSTHQPSFPWVDTSNWPQYTLINDGTPITVDGDLSDWSGASYLFTECDAYDQKTSSSITHCFDFYATVYGDMLYVGIDYTDDTTDDVGPTGAPSEDGAKVMFATTVAWNVYDEPFTKDEESCHLIEYYAVDALGNEEEVKYQCVFVDNTGPEAYKEHEGPYIPDEGFGWVTKNTDMYLWCEDQGDHPVEQETIYWRFSTYDNPDFENPTYDPADGWYSGPSAVKASSSSMRFSSTGWGGWSCPEGTFVVGGGYEPYPADHPVAHSLAWKPGACVDSVCWPNTPFGYTYSEGETGWIVQNGGEAQDLTVYAMCAVPLTFPEDCWHDLEYYCVDHLGNVGPTHVQYYIVDTAAPIIEKTIEGPKYGDCVNPGAEDECYIDGKTKIYVEVTDPQPHPVDEVMCAWDYEVIDGEKIGHGEQEVTPPFYIQFPEESTHMLYITCWDKLGNTVRDVEKFIVDKTPPVTTKWYVGPQYSEIDYFQTTTGDQAVDISVEDLGDSIKWTVDFPIDDDTCNGLMAVGLIIATDGEGNGPVFQIHNNDGTDATYNWGTWLYSPWGPTIGDGWFGWHSGDTNTPVTDLDWVEATGGRYREGKPDCPEPNPNGIFTITIDKSELGMDFHWALYTAIGSGFCSHAYQQATYPNAFMWNEPIVSSTNYEYAEGYPRWITSETEVWLSATDPEPHPSGVNKTYYRDIYFGEKNQSDWHYCLKDCYNWEYDDRYSAYGLPTAPEPYNPKSVDPSWEEWTGTPFYKTPESCHIIEYYSYDNVMKVERPKWQCVFVDDSAPTPNKTVGEPKTPWEPTEVGVDVFFYPDLVEKCWKDEAGDGMSSEDCKDDPFCIECWKVTMETPITLDCNDPDPHPVDHEEVCFYVELDGINATEDYCDNYDGTYDKYGDGYCCLAGPIDFSFHEETEHNLDFYCIDALGNSNEVHDDEKFKVEGTAFEIPLYFKWNLISVPFVLLNDAPAEVFKDTPGVEAVWAYDGETGDWLVYAPDLNLSDTVELNGIEPGWGYWVMEKNSDNGLNEPSEWLTIGGSLFSPATVPPSRNLVKGWNLIGYYGSRWQLYPWSDENFMCGDAMNCWERNVFGDKVYCALNSLVDTQQGFPKWSALWSYLNCGEYETHWFGLNTCPEDDGFQELMSRMYAGRGYWLELDEDDMYAPATTCIWNEDWECV